MKKTRFGLLLCLAVFVSSILLHPPFRQRAESVEPQANSSAGGLFVSYQNGQGVATRQLAAAESAAYIAAQGRRQDALYNLGNSNRALAKSRGGLSLILRATPQLEKFPQAKAALQRAAAHWESLIQDQISVVVDVDFGGTYFGQPFSPNAASLTNALGRRTSTSDDYMRVIDRMRRNTLDPRQKEILAALPDGVLPMDIGNANTVITASPIARVLGILPADADPNDNEEKVFSDLPAIGFNSAVKFDFDPSDGIDPDKIDFEALATRELGRVVGFISNTGVAEIEPGRAPYLTVWDLFRFRPGVTWDTIAQSKRIMLSGGEQVFFAGGEEIPLSTAKPDGTGGDGNPAGHWKDDALTGRYMGIMDPTLAAGERGGITAVDVEALRLIGYQVPFDAPVIEVLSADDNSREESVKLGGAMIVTRLAPSRYPAVLQSIRVQLPVSDAPLAGAQLRVVAFVDSGRTSRPPANPRLIVDRSVTIQSLPENRMLEVMIPNAPVVSEGDLYIGVQSSSSALTIGADAGSIEQRSLISTNNGASFQPLLTSGKAPLNLIARAVVGGRIENYVTPATNSLSPSSVPTGGQDFTLTVYGHNFSFNGFGIPINSTVHWNGQERSTTFINGSTLQAQIPASDVAQAGTARITVYTQTPNGALESGPIEIRIAAGNALPVVTRLLPDEASVGGAAFNLTVYGRDFAPASVARWNGKERATLFSSSTELSVAVLREDQANAVNAEITVFTPGPGGGASNSLRLPIAPCQYKLDLVNSIYSSFGDTGGAVVTTGRQCAWTMQTDNTWIRPPNDANRMGSGLLTYSVTANSNPNPRAGSITIAGQKFNVRSAGRLTALSAAGFGDTLALGSIAAAFGGGLANEMQSATNTPLPFALAGAELRVADYKDVPRAVPLFYASPGQINFFVPADLELIEDPFISLPQNLKLSVYRNGELAANGFAVLASVWPGLFTANADGLGPPAGLALHIKASGAQSYEPIGDYDPARKRFVTRPIDLGDESDKVYLVLFGTGIRGRKDLSLVNSKIAEFDAPVLYAGPQGDFLGLDQVNVLLPRGLKGRGEVRLVISVDGRDANQVRVAFQ